jgi:RHS repeat-associated protein
MKRILILLIISLFICTNANGQSNSLNSKQTLKNNAIPPAAEALPPGEGGGGGSPFDPPDLSSYTPDGLWSDQGLNSADGQSIVVTLDQSDFNISGATLSSVQILSVSGSGLSTVTVTTTDFYNGDGIHVHTYTSVPDNQTVQFKLKVIYSNKSPNYSYTGTKSIVIGDRTAPSTPTNPTVTWNDQGLNTGDLQKVTVTYNKPSGATKVRVEKVTGTGTSNSSWYTGSSGSYQDTGINDEQTVSYKLRAEDAAGNYSTSSTISTTIADRTAPGLPFFDFEQITWTNSASKNTGDNQTIEVDYYKPSGATKVNVTKVSGSGVNSSGDLTASSGTYTDTGVYDSQTISYKIVAYDAEGNNSTSATEHKNIADRTAPSTPTNPTVTWNDQGLNTGDLQKVTVTYNKPSGATRVRVEKVTGTGTSNSGWYTGSSGSYQDTGINDEQSVSYKIRAEDSEGNYSNSATVITTIDDRTAPSTPADPIVTWNDQGLNSANTQKVTITYNKPSGATRVRVEQSSGIGTTNSGWYTSSSGSFQDTGINDDQSVSYKIRAEDSEGNYSNSAIGLTSISDRTAPNAPVFNIADIDWTNSASKNTGDSQTIEVDYVKPSGATKVIVTKVSGSGVDSSGDLTASSGTYTDTGVYDSQTISYKIVAYDTELNFAESTTRSKVIEDRTAPVGSINVSTTNPTNGNVSAALSANEGITVTNNGGSTNYTFTENGSFTFNFEDSEGNTSTKQVVVTNIDKTPPSLTAVIIARSDSLLLNVTTNASNYSVLWRSPEDSLIKSETVNANIISYINQADWKSGTYSAEVTVADSLMNDTTNTYYHTFYTKVLVDSLNFSYLNGSLSSVSDFGSDGLGFIDENTVGDDYEYDVTGNVTKDLNRGITHIHYNRFNLPDSIFFLDSSYVLYSYDAKGQRSRKLHIKNNGDTASMSRYIRNSAGQIIAEINKDGKLNYESISANGEMIGQKVYNSATKTENRYFLKDHLGNTRITIKDKRLLFSDGFENPSTRSNSYWSWEDNQATPKLAFIVDSTDQENIVLSLSSTNGAVLQHNWIDGLVVGKSYKLKAKIKVHDSSIDYAGIQYQFYNGATPLNAGYYFADKNQLNNWQEIEANIVAPLNATKILFMPKMSRYTTSQATVTSVFFDDISFEEALDSTKVQYSIVSSSDYYPFGMEVVGRGLEVGTGHKFKYQGKERDAETIGTGIGNVGYDYFEARLYDSAIGRFMQVDPLAEKFKAMNPYMGMFNNPIDIVDPSGTFGVTSKAISILRKAAVRRAWRAERKALRESGETSMKLSAKEKDELLKTGKVTGWEGHHINSVNHHSLELAEDPNNIKFVKGRKAHLAEHDGHFQNKTTGDLIDRVSNLSNGGLLVFLTEFDNYLNKAAKENSAMSDPDSWLSFINPVNIAIEQVALLFALYKAVDYEDEMRKKNRSNSGSAENSNDEDEGENGDDGIGKSEDHWVSDGSGFGNLNARNRSN